MRLYFIFLFAGSCLTVATSTRADPAYDQCINQSDGTNYAWGQCGAALVARGEAGLNADWKRTYPKASAASKTPLLAEQRAWIIYKDKSCAMYSTGDYGREGEVLSFPTCRAGVINARRAVLNDYEASINEH